MASFIAKNYCLKIKTLKLKQGFKSEHKFKFKLNKFSIDIHKQSSISKSINFFYFKNILNAF